MPRHLDRKAGAEAGEAAVAQAMIAVWAKENWSPKVLRDRLLAYYDEVVTTFDDDDVDHSVVPSEASLRRIRQNVGIPTKDFAWFLEHWLTAKYPEFLARERRTADQPFVAHCRAVLGRTPDPVPSKMDKYIGHYALYRPFHLRPRQQIIVERFSIGENGNSFACELSSRYPHITEMDGTDSQGLCVPHGRKLMALMTVESDSYSQILVYFDRVHTKNHRDESKSTTVIAMTGIMMASVGDADDASAWPVYLQRVPSKQDVDRKVIEGLQIHDLPDLAQKSLQRGAVYWNGRDHVEPFGKLRM